VPAAFDEAYDATWLALETAGWPVTSFDPRAATLSTGLTEAAHGTRRGWAAMVSQEGAVPIVTLLPRVYAGEREVTQEMHWVLEGPGGEQQRWDELFARILGLVESWRHHPELSLGKARGEVEAAGLRLLLPPSWKHFEFSTDRRTLVVQRFQRRSGINPTLVYRIERLRPVPELAGILGDALERAFHSRTLLEPAQWETSADGSSGEGEVQAAEGGVAQSVRWRRWEARSPAWRMWVVAVCSAAGELACDAETREVLESAGAAERWSLPSGDGFSGH
jgi:hypothetical protein